MRNKPRFLLWTIVTLTAISMLIVLPKIQKISLGKFSLNLNFDQNAILRKLRIDKEISFHKGLDLAGGTSLTFAADMSDIPPSQKENALSAAKRVIERRVNLFGVAESIVQTSKTSRDYRIIVELPGLTDLAKVKELVGTTAQLTFWEEIGTQSAQLSQNEAYPFNLPPGYKKTNLSGADLKEATVGFNQNTGNPEVILSFTSDGSGKFAQITQRTVGKKLAIVLDNLAIEVPTVNEPILGGNAQISGGFTVDSAKTLATELNGGALPVPLKTLQSHVIEPTLGASSLQKSIFAAILGFITIVVFMSVLYGRLGIIAALALFLYVLFVLALFKLIPVTLTLAGIAGFVLSVGMAVDANILIFERMKEEQRKGLTKETAIEVGFSRAWTSIKDSNISTIITSIVLYNFGVGLVKGFALVLAIGVLVSMFSAIVVTRTLLRISLK